MRILLQMGFLHGGCIGSIVAVQDAADGRRQVPVYAQTGIRPGERRNIGKTKTNGIELGNLCQLLIRGHFFDQIL